MSQLEIDRVKLLVCLVTERSRDWLLSLVRVVAPRVHLEFAKHMPGKRIFLGKHAFYRLMNQVGWFAFQAFRVALHLLAVIPVVPGVVSFL